MWVRWHCHLLLNQINQTLNMGAFADHCKYFGHTQYFAGKPQGRAPNAFECEISVVLQIKKNVKSMQNQTLKHPQRIPSFCNKLIMSPVNTWSQVNSIGIHGAMYKLCNKVRSNLIPWGGNPPRPTPARLLREGNPKLPGPGAPLPRREPNPARDLVHPCPWRKWMHGDHKPLEI